MSTSTIKQAKNLVGGEWRESASGKHLDVRDPADEREIVAQVPAMSATDMEEVYDAATIGASVWAHTSPVARGRILIQAAHLLRDRREAVARDLTREMGKTLAEATGEVSKSADFLEYCGGLGRAPQGDLLGDERSGVRVWTVREPLGVVLAICPWNDPLLTPARKVAPALIAGNSVVLKPATYTPLVSLHLAQALADAGLPDGALNTVTGRGAEISGPLLRHPALKAVSFTGSNSVGEQLGLQLAGSGVKLQGELGGKNATVVLDDADLDVATTTIVSAGFAQAGQRCTATSRVIATAGIAERLLESLAAEVGSLTPGPGLNEATTLGPVVAPDALTDIAGFVDRAIADGVKVVTGGSRITDRDLRHGNFFSATLLANVDRTLEIWNEEVFGPVVAVSVVSDIAAAIAAVNESQFGLASAIFTRDLSSALRFADEAETGQISVNLPTSGWDVHMPFGGFKASGTGTKEQGTEGVAWYTRTKTVAVAA